MKYKILMAHTPIELSWGVNRDIAKEWQPLGGIAVCNIGEEGISYSQAMELHRTDEGADQLQLEVGAKPCDHPDIMAERDADGETTEKWRCTKCATVVDYDAWHNSKQ